MDDEEKVAPPPYQQPLSIVGDGDDDDEEMSPAGEQDDDDDDVIVEADEGSIIVVGQEEEEEAADDDDEAAASIEVVPSDDSRLRLRAHTKDVFCVGVSAPSNSGDGGRWWLATGAEDDAVVVWDLAEITAALVSNETVASNGMFVWAFLLKTYYFRKKSPHKCLNFTGIQN